MWHDQMGVKCNYFNTPRSKIFHSSKFYWYQKKSVYKIWNSPIKISEFYSLREIGMEFKGSNFILFSKSQCCTCIFSSYYQEISFYFILFPQIVLHKRLQTAIVLCFHWRRFLGREYLLYTLPLLLWSHRRSRYTACFHSTNTLSVNQYWVSLVTQDCRQRSLATLCLRVHINKRNF